MPPPCHRIPCTTHASLTISYISHLCPCTYRAQAGLRSAGINPRTKMPYKRAPYKKDDKPGTSAGAVLKAVEAAKQKAAKEATDKEVIAELKSNVKLLEGQVGALERNLTVSVEKAKFEATAGMHELLLKRYQDGLRDGASLSRGLGFGSSPSFFGSTPTSDRTD